jgi:hypothetical protein
VEVQQAHYFPIEKERRSATNRGEVTYPHERPNYPGG